MFLAYHDRILNVFKTVVLIPIVLTWRVFHPCQTPYEVANFIIRHNMALKYDIHFNRMANFIIHSFYVAMGSFAFDYIFTVS